MTDYPTWYEFKKALERETGRRLLNTDWLRVKPAAPLPWGNAQFHSAVDQLGHQGTPAAQARPLVVAK